MYRHDINGRHKAILRGDNSNQHVRIFPRENSEKNSELKSAISENRICDEKGPNRPREPFNNFRARHLLKPPHLQVQRRISRYFRQNKRLLHFPKKAKDVCFGRRLDPDRREFTHRGPKVQLASPPRTILGSLEPRNRRSPRYRDSLFHGPNNELPVHRRRRIRAPWAHCLHAATLPHSRILHRRAKGDRNGVESHLPGIFGRLFAEDSGSLCRFQAIRPNLEAIFGKKGRRPRLREATK